MGFLPIFSFLCPYVLNLESGMGQTDRQTDNDYQCIMPVPYGGRHKKINKQITHETDVA